MINECKACGVIAELTEWEGWPRGTHKHLCVFCANTEAGAVLDDDRNYTEDQRLMLRTMSRIGHVLLVKLGKR